MKLPAITASYKVGVCIDGSGVWECLVEAQNTMYPWGLVARTPRFCDESLCSRKTDVNALVVVPCVLELLLGRGPSGGAFTVDIRGDSAWHRLFRAVVFIVLN